MQNAMRELLAPPGAKLRAWPDGRLTDAAARLYARRDFEAVLLWDAAQAVGVPMHEAVARFTDERELLGSVTDLATDTLFWQPPVRGLDPRTKLEHLTRRHLSALREHPDLALAVIRHYEQLTDPYRTSFRHRTERYRAPWRDVINALAPRIAPKNSDPIAMAMLDALNAGPLPRSAREVERRTAGFVAAAVRSLSSGRPDHVVFHDFADAAVASGPARGATDA
jgi:hypothetical protein